MGDVKILIHIKLCLTISICFLVFSLLFTSSVLAYTSTYTDNKGDVIIDKGYTDVFDFSMPKLYDAPYLDMVSMKYNLVSYPSISKIDLTMAGAPKNNSAYYWFYFKGYTGNIEGPGFSIDALDTIAEFSIEFVMNNVSYSDISFYDASINQSYDNQTYTVTIDGNHVIIEFVVPQDFDLSKLMTQESFDYLVTIELDVGDLTASDDMGNSHQGVGIALFLFLKYWWVIPIVLVLISVGVYLIIKRRRSNRTSDSESK